MFAAHVLNVCLCITVRWFYSKFREEDRSIASLTSTEFRFIFYVMNAAYIFIYSEIIQTVLVFKTISGPFVEPI